MENSEKSKLFDEKILSIARDYKSGKSVNELVDFYSVTHKFVRDIIHCRTHKKLLFDNGITPVESRKLGHLDENKVIDICESLMNKETEESLANKYNVSLGAIDAIRRHISWKHITDKYDFDSVELKSAPRIDQVAAERMVKMLDNGMTQRYVAEKFGVTHGTVMKIKKKLENNEKINESRIKNPTRIYNASSNTKPIYQFNEIQRVTNNSSFKDVHRCCSPDYNKIKNIFKIFGKVAFTWTKKSFGPDGGINPSLGANYSEWSDEVF